MNINILRYSLFGIAGGQEVDHNFSLKYKMSVAQRAKAISYVRIYLFHLNNAVLF